MPHTALSEYAEIMPLSHYYLPLLNFALLSRYYKRGEKRGKIKARMQRKQGLICPAIVHGPVAKAVSPQFV